MTRLESMIRDIATPEKTLSAKPETFRSHVPAIAAAATGTVLAAVLGSMIGTAGTVVGMAIGSLASGTCSWWAERAIRRSTALATAQAEALRSWSHVPHTGETAATAGSADATTDRSSAETDAQGANPEPARHGGRPHGRRQHGGGQHGRPARRWRWRWSGPVLIVLVAFTVSAAVVTVVEGAAGKPLSAVVQGQPGHGTTLGGGGVGKDAKATPSSTPSGSPSATASASSTGAGPSSSATGSSSGSPSPSSESSPTPSSTGPTSPAPTSGVRSVAPSGTTAGR